MIFASEETIVRERGRVSKSERTRERARALGAALPRAALDRRYSRERAARFCFDAARRKHARVRNSLQRIALFVRARRQRTSENCFSWSARPAECAPITLVLRPLSAERAPASVCVRVPVRASWLRAGIVMLVTEISGRYDARRRLSERARFLGTERVVAPLPTCVHVRLLLIGERMRDASVYAQLWQTLQTVWSEKRGGASQRGWWWDEHAAAAGSPPRQPGDPGSLGELSFARERPERVHGAFGATLSIAASVYAQLRWSWETL